MSLWIVDAVDEHEAWLLSQQGRAPDGDSTIDFEALDACRQRYPVPKLTMKRIVATSIMKLSSAGNFGSLSFVDFVTFDGETMGEGDLVPSTLNALNYAAGMASL